MKKKIVVMLSLVLCLMLSISLAACNKNKHEAKSEWKFDNAQHWHECATKGHDDKLDVAAHVYDNNEDVTCNLCGYERTVAPSVKAYTISFETNGGSSIKSIQAEAGEEISAPVAPTKSGERFIGWYESTDGGTTLNTTAFVFGYMPGKNITLYAKWQDAVIGSWETSRIIMPAETEGGEDTVINKGKEFPLLGIKKLTEDTYKLSVDDTSINLTLTIESSNTATGSGTYTKSDGVYAASIVLNNGEASETFKTLTTYDETNDELSCKILYYETEAITLYYTLILTRVNG